MATHAREREQQARRHAASRPASDFDGLRLLSPSASARGPPRLGLTEFAEPSTAPFMAPNAEKNVIESQNQNQKNEVKCTVEVRCPKDQCRCSARGKLLVTLIDAPLSLFDSGAVLQVACPSKKSRLLRIRL